MSLTFSSHPAQQCWGRDTRPLQHDHHLQGWPCAWHTGGGNSALKAASCHIPCRSRRNSTCAENSKRVGMQAYEAHGLGNILGRMRTTYPSINSATLPINVVGSPLEKSMRIAVSCVLVSWGWGAARAACALQKQHIDSDTVYSSYLGTSKTCYLKVMVVCLLYV